MLTGPSAMIALLMRVTSPCRYDGFMSGVSLACNSASSTPAVGELLDELLAAQTRGLFLQLQFADAVAQRLQRTLGGETGFVGGAQLGGQIVEFEARGVQRFFLDRTDVERVLQPGVRGLLR